jgi:hypothetical protein
MLGRESSNFAYCVTFHHVNNESLAAFIIGDGKSMPSSSTQYLALRGTTLCCGTSFQYLSVKKGMDMNIECRCLRIFENQVTRGYLQSRSDETYFMNCNLPVKGSHHYLYHK